MKITFKGDYALKIILDLALLHKGEQTQMKDIAKRQDIPIKFLEQIVLALKRAGYLRTARGPKGGLALAKAPGRITLGEIVRLIEGPTSPIGCVSTTGYTPCDFERRCVFKPVWKEIKDRVNEVLDQTTFEDMIERARQLQPAGAADFCI
jgi:Rrf2 family transcriptional regulator, cysteine metabolism repressor